MNFAAKQSIKAPSAMSIKDPHGSDSEERIIQVQADKEETTIEDMQRRLEKDQFYPSKFGRPELETEKRAELMRLKNLLAEENKTPMAEEIKKVMTFDTSKLVLKDFNSNRDLTQISMNVNEPKSVHAPADQKMRSGQLESPKLKQNFLNQNLKMENTAPLQSPTRGQKSSAKRIKDWHSIGANSIENTP